MKQEDEFHIVVTGEEGSEVRASVSGSLSLRNVSRFGPEMSGIIRKMKPSVFVVDISALSRIDSSGALALSDLQESSSSSMPVRMEGASGAAAGLVGLIDRRALSAEPLIPGNRGMGLIEHLGDATVSIILDMRGMISFLGELIIALVYCVFHPRSVRWDDVVVSMKKVGEYGVPIVGLIGMLLGLIMAFMSSLQLKQFGANIYVANLVGFALVRELGPIMTAILVAGRSGSAFAAEIGTMKVNEEVDALMVMGFDPVKFLAVPRIVAAVSVVPLLTFYADFFGILGGLVIGVVGLDMTAYTYIVQTQKSIKVFDVVSSLVKSCVFAAVIAAVGCRRGFQVSGSAESVGTATTSAVVTSIFLIILIDSVFAILLYYIR